jgi:hypothetical protein
MNVVPTILNVKGSALLEKAIADQELHSMDENDLRRGFLDELGVDYPEKTLKTKKVLTDNLDNGGQDEVPQGQRDSYYQQKKTDNPV